MISYVDDYRPASHCGAVVAAGTHRQIGPGKSHDGAPDVSTYDATLDTGVDGTTDSALDAGADATDSGFDATLDVIEASVDGGLDAPSDAPSDADANADVVDAAIIDASGPDASACSYGDAGNGNYCNSLPQSSLVNVGCLTSFPTAQGGTIVPGLYELTSAAWDQSKLDGGGCYANQTRRDTIEICGNVLLWLDIDTVNSSYDGNNTFSTNGSTMTLTPYCSGGGPTIPYTATSTTLTLELDYPNNGPALLLTLTKQ